MAGEKLNFCFRCGCRIEADEAEASWLDEPEEFLERESRGWQHAVCPKVVWVPFLQAENLAMSPQPFEKLEDAKEACDERLRGVIITPRSGWETGGSKAGMNFTTMYVRQLLDPLYAGETWQSVEAFRVK